MKKRPRDLLGRFRVSPLFLCRTKLNKEYGRIQTCGAVVCCFKCQLKHARNIVRQRVQGKEVILEQRGAVVGNLRRSSTKDCRAEIASKVRCQAWDTALSAVS